VTTQLIPYSTFVRQFEREPSGTLCCVHGSGSVFRLSLHAAARALLGGVPIVVVDGANRFDAYFIAEFARRVAGDAAMKTTPGGLLDSIFISRAFTCYQMEAVMTNRLLEFVKKKGSPVAVVFGLLDTFYDEQAPLFEVQASLQRIITALYHLKSERISVLLASRDVSPASKERNMLFPALCTSMDRVYAVANSASGVLIHLEPRGRNVPLRG